MSENICKSFWEAIRQSKEIELNCMEAKRKKKTGSDDLAALQREEL